MNKIIKLEKEEDFKEYNPIFVLNEDIYNDNQFYILLSSKGNIAFSYYDLGVTPCVFIQNKILFLSFGKSLYVIDLLESKLLYQSIDIVSVIYEIVKNNYKSCVVFVGEISLLCFSLNGELMWENCYRDTINDWIIGDEQIVLIFETGEKLSISFDNGNGISIY